MSGFDALGGLRSNLWSELAPRVPSVPTAPSGDAETQGGAVNLDFGATLGNAIRGVTDLQEEANDQAMALVRGEPVHMHDVLVAMGKSEVAFDLMIEVRNKLLQAWETLSRSVV